MNSMINLCSTWMDYPIISCWCSQHLFPVLHKLFEKMNIFLQMLLTYVRTRFASTASAWHNGIESY